MTRRLAREMAMKALFARDVGAGRPRDALDHVSGEEGAGAEDSAAAAVLVDGVLGALPRIDRLIAAYARDWSVPRLAAVDRNVLRVALFELVCAPELPPDFVIDEAVEIAKVYGGEDSSGFVHGVLGQVGRDRAAGAPGP